LRDPASALTSASSSDTRVLMKTVDEAATWNRMICLSLMHKRSFFEATVGVGAIPREAIAAAIAPRWNGDLERARERGIFDMMAPEERELLEAPIGAWTQRQLLDASWSVEGLAVLAWALSLGDVLPPWDQKVDTPVLMRSIVRDRVKLRPATEIHAARELAELYNWRARTLRLERTGADCPVPPGWTLAQIVAKTATMAEERKLFRSVDGDFPAQGKPYGSVDEAAAAELSSIAQERHRALNWLCCYGADWYSVPTDT
jgi:hypothetical protein